ncbi:hypothetical protein N7470_003635 [Penicillium chermesinum]|nr:hypothetical protein N7470_003635 [Penicillium chermesinum]
MSAKDQQPGAFLPRPLKAIVIGAGFSGIQISRDIKVELPEIELEVYEKNPGLGGTCRDEWLAAESDVLVYAVGRLNNYKIPTTEGLSSFEGTVAHTAAWPEGLDIRDKGLSLLEMEPVPCNVYQHYSQVRKSLVVSQLINIARGPTWIVPHLFSDDGNTAEERKTFRDNQTLYDSHRVELERKVAAGLSGLWKGTVSQERFLNTCETFMRAKIQDPELLNALLPDFEAGCRRFTPGGHYLDALQQPNVQYRQDSIIQTDSLLSVCVKLSAQQEFNEWTQSRMPEMVWSGKCSSWCQCWPFGILLRTDPFVQTRIKTGKLWSHGLEPFSTIIKRLNSYDGRTLTSAIVAQLTDTTASVMELLAMASCPLDFHGSALRYLHTTKQASVSLTY